MATPPAADTEHDTAMKYEPSADTRVETRTHRLLGDPSRALILQLLQDRARPLSASEAANEVGLHPTTARFHLELLTDAGLVERTTEVRASRGRPRTLYRSVGGGRFSRSRSAKAVPRRAARSTTADSWSVSASVPGEPSASSPHSPYPSPTKRSA